MGLTFNQVTGWRKKCSCMSLRIHFEFTEVSPRL